ncbi:Xaa-Pro peptidase family protein [Agrobacterium cavarae]|uniref:Xaa-Pro peptidase family protein n=1 Tax=Agrobacterium cavarae TaxID=2528239 RepID=UPI0028A046EA|nr:Xaa-Pro peptidase family protein [Agrobacterium cavarae]
MGDIDRKRAERLMQAAGLDALVLFQPEAFRYAIGAPAGVATMWGRAGAAIAIVPADSSVSLGAVASDHAAGMILKKAPSVDLRIHRIWIDLVDMNGAETVADIDPLYKRSGRAGSRPETFDRAASYNLLFDILKERNLARGRIGVDLEFVPAADFEALKHALPNIQWVDGSEVLRRLRAVKTSLEIERLRRAASAAEGGLARMMELIKPGASVSDLSAAWKVGAQDTAKARGFALSGHWDFISVGPDLSDMSAIVTAGAVIKADVGTLVDGYSSDGARTFSHGPVSSLAQDIFKALESAFAVGLEEIKPGNSFGAVHQAMLMSMRRDGLGEYYRGHFGHSVGGSVGIKEWPFFSADNPEIIEVDMVIALEAPFYGENFGALMIEDQFLVTSTGVDDMNTMPRELVDTSGDQPKSVR